jgi:flagellar motor protein MotB
MLVDLAKLSRVVACVPAKDLLTVGFGKSELKNPSDPFGAENRRVRVTNTVANVANE